MEEVLAVFSLILGTWAPFFHRRRWSTEVDLQLTSVWLQGEDMNYGEKT